LGGTDLGPSPFDYLNGSLGACTTMTLQMYAKRKKWDLRSAKTKISHQKTLSKDARGGQVNIFERELELEGDLTEEQRNRMLEIAEKCPVHRLLHSDVQIKTTLKT